MLRVLPTDQRLHAGDPPAMQVDLRLIVHDELLALKRRANLPEQDQAG